MLQSSPSFPSLARVPKFKDDHLGQLAVQLAAGYGLSADPWQADIVVPCLALHRDGRYAAATVKVSVPRQNGKNGFIEIRELFGMVVLGERFLHTAHEVKTARKAFARLKHFFGDKANDPGAKYPELNALVREVRSTNGQEAIYLTNGGSIEFIARSKGSGRGFTVDVLVLDEDQDLTDEELAALLPTISSAPLKNPQVILTGTPPDPEKSSAAQGEVAKRIRREGIDGTDKRLLCVDYGVKDGPLPDVDDRDLWWQTNPSLGGRLSIGELERERKLMSPEQFARERLGWWGDPETDGGGVIDLVQWATLARKDAAAPTRAVLVVDVSPNRSSAAVGVAGAGPDGRTLGFAQTSTGTAWIVPALKRILDRPDRTVIEVALNPASQAGALIPDLVKADIEFEALTTRDQGQACAAFQELVDREQVAHIGQPALDAAVANAKTRYAGEVELWDRRDRNIDISPLVAVSTAVHRWRLLEGTDADYDVTDSFL